MTKSNNQQTFFELVNCYPSPHNGQPIRIKPTGDTTYNLCFDKSRGLQSTDISFIFSFVSMGVFVEHLQLCAKALGHTVQIHTNLPPESSLRGEGLEQFASISIQWNVKQPDNATLELAKVTEKSHLE